MSIETTRILVLMFGISLGLIVAIMVVLRWQRMNYAERMFSMSYTGIVLAPLVGVVERYQQHQDFWWADEVIFVSLAWSAIGVVAAWRDQSRPEHPCPECGTVHYIGETKVVHPVDQ